jgi:hypothetical protein
MSVLASAEYSAWEKGDLSRRSRPSRAMEVPS